MIFVAALSTYVMINVGLVAFYRRPYASRRQNNLTLCDESLHARMIACVAAISSCAHRMRDCSRNTHIYRAVPGLFGRGTQKRYHHR